MAQNAFKSILFPKIRGLELTKLSPEEFCKEVRESKPAEVLYVLNFIPEEFNKFLKTNSDFIEIFELISNAVQTTSTDHWTHQFVVGLDKIYVAKILAIIEKEIALNILMKLEEKKRNKIINLLTKEKADELIGSLHPEDTAQVLKNLKQDDVIRILSSMEERKKRTVEKILDKHTRIVEIEQQINNCVDDNDMTAVISLIESIKDRPLKRFLIDRLDEQVKIFYQWYTAQLKRDKQKKENK